MDLLSAFIGWGFDSRLTRIPGWRGATRLGEFKFDTENFVYWDLAQTSVDMVPKGLKGVDVVLLAKTNGPIFDAPDFQGIVGVYERNEKILLSELDNPNNAIPFSAIPIPGFCSFHYLTEEEIKVAKYLYQQHEKFVETPRFMREVCAGEPGDPKFKSCYHNSGCVLPNNIKFYKQDGKFYLDLSQTTIFERPWIRGIKCANVIMPAQKIAHHKGHQMSHSKPKIYEN